MSQFVGTSYEVRRGASRSHLARLLPGVLTFLVFLSACSDGGDPGGSSPPDDESSADEPDDSGAADSVDSAPTPSVDEADVDDQQAPPGNDPGSFEFDTGGLIDYLAASFPEADFALEISLLFVTDDEVLVNLQTSFFEPEEAVALCEAVAAFVDAAGGPGKLGFVSTSGADVADRASADSPCMAGDDL